MDYCGKEIAANLYIGAEAVGGKLHFDETGVEFSPHPVNADRGGKRIAYSEITDVYARNELGFVPTGLMIATEDGREHHFVVFHRERIRNYLLQKSKK